MKFAITPYDKAIAAAVLAPIFSLITSYVNGGIVIWPKDYLIALLAAAGAGLAVYFKANAPADVPTPVPTVVKPAP